MDSTFTLVAGTHYTIAAVGNLRAPRTAKFLILTDNYAIRRRTSPCASPTWEPHASLDVYGSAAGGTSALPATPLAAALAAFTASPWNNMTPGPLALRANAAGSTTLPAMIDAAAPAGVAADQGAQPHGDRR